VKVWATVQGKSKMAVITRGQVITLMDKKYKFFTDSRDYNMNDMSGETELTPVKKYGDGFIRTEENSDPKDNLGNLDGIKDSAIEPEPLGFIEFSRWLDQYWK